MGRPQSIQNSIPILWRVLRYLWPTLRRERPLIIGSMAALLASSSLALIAPWPLKIVIDDVLLRGQRGPDSLGVLAGAMDPATLLIVAAVGVVAIAGLRAIFDYCQTVGFALIGNRTLTRLRDELYQHVQRLSLRFHSQARSGDLVARVTTDMSLLKDAAATALLPLLANVLTVAGMVVVMFVMEWKLALVAIAIGPLFWLCVVVLGRRVHQAARKQRKCDGALTAAAAESISAVRTVQALSLEAIFARDFAACNKKSLKEGVQTSRMSARLERSVDVLIAIGTAVVLWGGARMVLSGAISPGALLVFLYYLKHAFRPARNFAKYAARLAKAAAGGERVLELLERSPEVRDLPDAVPASPFRGAVRFEDVTFSYQSGSFVVQDVTLDVPPGTSVALVGPSGIGKSTLISLVLRLYDPERGRVLIDGCDIRRYTFASLRAQISVVMQDSILFNATIAENIAYAAANATRAEIEAAAQLANADEFIRDLPQGLDTVVGERGETLSYGQRQRLAIARAAIRKSPILILDEPLTGLDEINERLVDDALAELARDRTTFLVTHDLQLASRCDQIVYLERGRIVECGAHAELIAADGRYARLYRQQVLAEIDESERLVASG